MYCILSFFFPKNCLTKNEMEYILKSLGNANKMHNEDRDYVVDGYVFPPEYRIIKKSTGSVSYDLTAQSSLITGSSTQCQRLIFDFLIKNEGFDFLNGFNEKDLMCWHNTPQMQLDYANEVLIPVIKTYTQFICFLFTKISKKEIKDNIFVHASLPDIILNLYSDNVKLPSQIFIRIAFPNKEMCIQHNNVYLQDIARKYAFSHANGSKVSVFDFFGKDFSEFLELLKINKKDLSQLMKLKVTEEKSDIFAIWHIYYFKSKLFKR